MSAGKILQQTQDESDFTLSSLVAAAHELKSPLALIRQASLMLRDPELAQDPHRRARLLEQITLTSERSLRLIEMITRHARLEDALFELEPVHVGHICEEVASELWPLTQTAQRDVVLTVSSQSVVAVANRDLLRSIVLGLCDNSFAYASTDRPLELKVGQYQGAVRVAVRDYGPRLPLESFRRLQHTLGKTVQPVSQRPQSSGLGLFVAGRFAESMRGKLGTVRHREHGMTFFVDIPASRQLSLLSI
ncbi:MAG TPA: ATP-binding protein [Candidatus Saccharimonadales bacterium]